MAAAGSVVVAIPDTHSRTAPVWPEESFYSIWEQATDGPAYLGSLRSLREARIRQPRPGVAEGRSVGWGSMSSKTCSPGDPTSWLPPIPLFSPTQAAPRLG